MQALKIEGIPAIVWGKSSDKVYIYVHGKCACKESAETFAEIAGRKGWQTVSFDLPRHGERADEDYAFDIWNAIADLRKIGRYVFACWRKVALYGCSIGAFFSLHAYKERVFCNCLFQSPVLDMEYLIRKMFGWFSVTEKQLEEKGEIPTPIDTLSWRYYRYVREHPVEEWRTPTHILFGGRDEMQTYESMASFIGRFGGSLTFSADSEHSFLSPKDAAAAAEWLEENI